MQTSQQAVLILSWEQPRTGAAHTLANMATVARGSLKIHVLALIFSLSFCGVSLDAWVAAEGT